ncbi:type I-F CRISPR-associated endonuclease Cas1f [Utexia brackfieldae]|uniref:type I-F CRISPR-associated endonuclease Cas1f n=1 Tax=Utexia brackfieldae TaxID=3074108 RepID=UPI00370DDA8C
MEVLASSDLKAILHSKRANIYYLEYCRVMQKEGRVLYLIEAKEHNQYWNIPIANTTAILLGTGTSITQAAMRMLASAGVLVGFCGGGGTPLFSGAEIEWLTPQSEYRPTEYLQGWMGFWFDEAKRMQIAQKFQGARIEFIEHIWKKDKEIKQALVNIDDEEIKQTLTKFKHQITCRQSINELLLDEARLTKQLYKILAQRANLLYFERNRESNDVTNTFLNHGNYLAYGLAATTLWVLGIPHGFAVMHGKTRRGALVFDVADLVKDAIILPWAFICSQEKISDQAFRQLILQKFTDYKVLDFMFEQVKSAALHYKAISAI